MEELIKKLTGEVGLTEEQAIKALGAVTEYIKSKVPPMMHPMIENFLASKKDGDDDNPLSNLMKNFGG